jgi:hypothetical protein
MKSALLLPFVGLVAACGGSSSNPADDVVRVPTENGLPFAESGDTHTDAEGETLKVLIARFETDNATGLTTQTFSEETVTFEVGGIVSKNLTITLGDETITVVDGAGILESEQVLDFVGENSGAVSAVYSLGSYESDGIDTEGYFAYGFETNPDTIAATTGSATDRGNFHGYVQGLNAADEVTYAEILNRGSIVLTSNFSDQTVSGEVTGPTGGLDGIEYTGTFADVGITDNGFSSDYVIGCTGCKDGSGGQIEGTFFGDTGQEISGVATLNILLDDGSRYMGASGYVAKAVAEPIAD